MSLFEEVSDSRWESREQAAYWTACRRFVCANDTATSLANTLWNSVHPYFGGTFAPRCRRTLVERNYYAKDSARVSAWYRTMREPGKGKLVVDLNAKPVKVTKDLDGKLMDRWDEDGVHYYRVIKGSSIQYLPACTIILQTAYTTYDVAALMGMVGKVNSQKFLAADPGTLRYLGDKIVDDFSPEEELVYADHVFEFDPAGWNNSIQAQKTLPISVATEVYDAKTGEYTTDSSGGVLTYLNKAYVKNASGTGYTKQDTTPESRRMAEEADFSFFLALIGQ